MTADAEKFVKGKIKEAQKGMDKSFDKAAVGLKKRGKEIKDYLKEIHAEIQDWKFGIEESEDGIKIEWRVVAVIHSKK